MPDDPDHSGTPPRPPAGSTKPPPRPREVTWAAWLIMAGSLVVVLTAFERIAGLRSLDARRNVEEFLAEPPGQGLGLSVDRALDLIQVMSMVAGGTAAATGILGFQVLQQSKGARRALAVLSVPLFIGGLAAGGFMASLVVASVVWLYLQPARDWFEGVVRPDPPAAAPVHRGGPRPMVGFGRPPSGTSSESAPGSAPGSAVGASVATAPSTSSEPTAVPSRRPAPIVWACSITWAACGLGLLMLGGFIVVLATVPDVFFEELRAQDPNFAGSGLTDAEVVSAGIVTSSLLAIWCVTSIVFAVFAFQRVRWARIALLASASGSTALCLVGSVASVVLVVPLVLSVVTVALLVRPGTVSWFRAGP